MCNLSSVCVCFGYVPLSSYAIAMKQFNRRAKATRFEFLMRHVENAIS